MDQTQRNRPTFHLPRWRPSERASAHKLNQLADALDGMTAGIAPPRRIFRDLKRPIITERLIVEAATWDNTTFPASPDSVFDTFDYSEAFYTYGRCYVLVWQQTTTSENGIYAFDPSAPADRRWNRILRLTQDDMQDLEIFVRGGYRFAEWRFAWYSEHVIVPVFDRTIRINFASYETDETTSGLGAMQATHTPAAGELIYVRNNGLFITRSGSWIKIGAPLTISQERGPYGIIASQQIELQTTDSIECSGSDVVANQTLTRHELAVSPSLLNEEP